jgi:hypothetical protein
MLTHRARLALCLRDVFPASRPELVQQLRGIGELNLASLLALGLAGALDAHSAFESYERFVADELPRIPAALR